MSKLSFEEVKTFIEDIIFKIKLEESSTTK